MTENEKTNERFAELRRLASLDTEGKYAVVSVGLFGRYNEIGRTDSIWLAVHAAELLRSHAVPCETFEARDALA